MNMINSYYVVIPARYQSTRFPGKPLADINGKKLIERVYERCLKVFPADKIFIATDDSRIFEFCTTKNFNVAMTSSACLTGTDRIAEFALKNKADLYINVQGDEPLITAEDLTKIFNAAISNPNLIINGYNEINSQEAFSSLNVPKVVVDLSDNLLYMSRSPIPHSKNQSLNLAKRQVCIYSFPYECLKAFAGQKQKTPLEQHEDIEILRFLEMGYKVKMIKLSNNSFAVDVKEDIEIILAELKKRNEQ